MSQNIIKKTNIAVRSSLIFKAGQQVTALIMGIILARLLSPSEFGIIAIANMIIFYANSFTNFGLNNALIQKSNVEKIHINTVFTLDLMISLVLCLLTCLTAGYIGTFFNNVKLVSVLRWMSLYYIITTFYNIPVVILRRSIDFNYLNILKFVEALSVSICTVLLAIQGYSYWSIVVSSLSIQTLSAIILIAKTRWTPRLIIGRKMNDIYSFGFWNFIRAQLELLVSKTDYFVIGKYLGVYPLGLYEKSFELSSRAMSGFSMSLNGVFFSTISRIKNDVEKVKHVFLNASSLLGLITYPVLFGLVSVAPHFVLSCLGSQWENAILPLRILAFSSLFRVLFGMVANVNVVMGHYRLHTALNFLTSGVFIALCFYFVSDGVVAISLVYLFFCFSTFLVSFCLTCKLIKVSLLSLLCAIWCPLVGAIVMFLFVTVASKYLLTDTGSLIHLSLLVSLGIFVYSGWCYIFYRRNVISLSLDDF